MEVIHLLISSSYFCFCQLRSAVQKSIQLRRYKEAWALCQLLNSKEAWLDLAKSAVTNMELEFGKLQVIEQETYNQGQK